MVFENIGEIVQDDDTPAEEPSDEDKKKPKDEVDKLMEAYDNKEKHEEYLKSPEYAAIQKKKKDEEIDKQEDETSKLQEKLAQLENEKEFGIRTIGTKQLNAAKDDEFIQSMFAKYAEDGDNGIKIITKDKAYMACAKSLEHFKELKGKDNQDYLKANFNKMWDEHDIHNDK